MILLIKKYSRWIGFIIMIIILGIYMFVSQNHNQAVSQNDQAVTNILETEIEQELHKAENIEIPLKMFVDVKGEVKRAGVYEINEGDRVMDVIKLAGGFTEMADKTKVNLAAILTDEMVIYIPKIGEQSDAIMMDQTSHPNKSPKVNLNTAKTEELETLPGIGPSKAAAIISFREENGSFKKIEDIMEVQGIGKSTFESLKEQIVVK